MFYLSLFKSTFCVVDFVRIISTKLDGFDKQVALNFFLHFFLGQFHL